MTLYICDRRRCAPCQALHPEIDLGCRYTSDPEHAAHKGQEMSFEEKDGSFWEVNNGKAAGSVNR